MRNDKWVDMNCGAGANAVCEQLGESSAMRLPHRSDRTQHVQALCDMHCLLKASSAKPPSQKVNTKPNHKIHMRHHTQIGATPSI